MPARQKYRLRARSDREVIREVEPGKVYVDRESGEEFEVVGALLPLAPSPSDLPYAVENLRLCGCSLEQLVQKDLNDCPHCGRPGPVVGRRRLTSALALLALAAAPLAAGCGSDEEASQKPPAAPKLTVPRETETEPAPADTGTTSEPAPRTETSGGSPPPRTNTEDSPRNDTPPPNGSRITTGISIPERQCVFAATVTI